MNAVGPALAFCTSSRTRADAASRYKVVGAEPLYARGTDLFLTFGLEGSLGF